MFEKEVRTLTPDKKEPFRTHKNMGAFSAKFLFILLAKSSILEIMDLESKNNLNCLSWRFTCFILFINQM